MTDIVERLRKLEPASDRYYMHDVCVDALAEIERLRTVVDAAKGVVADSVVYEGGTTYTLIALEEALAALENDGD